MQGESVPRVKRGDWEPKTKNKIVLMVADHQRCHMQFLESDAGDVIKNKQGT